ncbi:MAG: gluconate 2-dehydrogenase subunit 3 family protein, partial [Mesorhizobium sp.]
MSTNEKNGQGDVGRRDFLKLFGAAGAAAGTASADEIVAAAATDTKHHHAAEPRARGGGYEFFNVDESAFVEAAVDTLIPNDAAGPGAKELGVATYIDRQ